MVLRPQSFGASAGWRMGADVELGTSDAATFGDLGRAVARLRPHISPLRVRFVLAGQKLVDPSRADWSLRRHGVHDGYVLCVQPTISDGWYWNDREYYVQQSLSAVAEGVAGAGGRVDLAELVARVALPPLLKGSLRTLLRQYPERFLLEVNVTDGSVVCAVAQDSELPTWRASALELVLQRR